MLQFKCVKKLHYFISILGGQTTITKKEMKGDENKTKVVDKITKDSKIQDSKRDNVKGIPSGTSVTVKSVKSPFLPNSTSEHFKKSHTTSSPSSNTTNRYDFP